MFGLVWFRNRGVDIPQLGAGFGISRATSYRYHDEVLAVPSAQAPDLTEALHRVEDEGWSHVSCPTCHTPYTWNWTVFPPDRVQAGAP